MQHAKRSSVAERSSRTGSFSFSLRAIYRTGLSQLSFIPGSTHIQVPLSVGKTLAITRSIKFYTYGNGIGEYFNHSIQDPTYVHLSSAVLAGVVTSTATNPIWLIKTRLQLDKEVASAAGKSRSYKNSN